MSDINYLRLSGLDAAAAEFMHIRNHPGYIGAFTTDQAKGAIPNGTRIVKAASEDKDTSPTGTLGTVLGSISDPDLGTLYFIEWDNRKKFAVSVISWKVKAHGPG